ncbi:hypothetical protein BDV36DRAFT_275023 [Aspergillus pseudocaelatus]|uniref:Uncharacterized protein n=1 Tax=Aspergillus pseudocaelatus TaxID=1825620 RepID=A0ABQ6W2E8_9EURO|nr:hypothetical protein BDV36DRAFT_275023 [Aspergillus pseudocaelatus]
MNPPIMSGSGCWMCCLVVDNPFGLSAWRSGQLLTSHSIFLINPNTLDVCSRIGSDVLTTILPHEFETRIYWTNVRDIESWLAMTHCPSSYLICMDVHTCLPCMSIILVGSGGGMSRK